MSATAVACEVDTAELVSLAEAIFVYIDELSAASAQGHSSQAGLRDVLRSRLAQALLDGKALTDPVGLQAAATPRAGCCRAVGRGVVPIASGREPTAPKTCWRWWRPRSPGDPARPVGPRAPTSPGTCMGGIAGVRGLVRPPAEAPISLAHARRVQRLVAQGRVPDTRVVAAADHLAELVAAADSEPLAELASRVTAPLPTGSPPSGRRWSRRCRSWLAFQGRPATDRGVPARAPANRLHWHQSACASSSGTHCRIRTSDWPYNWCFGLPPTT